MAVDLSGNGLIKQLPITFVLRADPMPIPTPAEHRVPTTKLPLRRP